MSFGRLICHAERRLCQLLKGFCAAVATGKHRGEVIAKIKFTSAQSTNKCNFGPTNEKILCVLYI